ncbi:J domain-containing protein [Dictyobacter arantiisoli]|nr:J domain-containing protein [Dictyobacter arantiisoli]
MNTFTDYYELLGVTADAPPEMVKAAFKKLALRYHPDVYKGADANERMSQLLQAYQILNDPATRKQYDARRSEHLLDGHVPEHVSASTSHSGSAAPPAQSHRSQKGSTVSPGARRDRQRHYDFPAFPPGKPVNIHLVDIDYALSADEAQQLRSQGLLRGVAHSTKDQQYFCHRCHHRWREERVGGSQRAPRYCPKCHALDWPEYLLLRCMHCRAVFESEQIRYEVGSYSYGGEHGADKGGLCPPYELFPLCPYCATARWSAAEDARVSDLRQKADRRALALRLLWISVFVIIFILLLLFLSGRF